MKKKVYGIILAASILATAILLYGRISTEAQADTVEIVADFDQFSELADQEGMPRSQIFSELRSAGIGAVALKEDSLFSLKQEGAAIEYDLVKTIKGRVMWQADYGKAAVAYLESEAAGAYDLVARTADSALFQRLVEGVSARYDAEFFRAFDEADVHTLVLKGTREDLYYSESLVYKNVHSKNAKRPRELISSVLEDVGLGYDPEKVSDLKTAEVNILLRPSTYHRYNSPIVDAYFDACQQLDATPTAIVFTGGEVLGYDSEKGMYPKALYERLKASGIPVGMVESTVQRGFTEQRGLEQLARDLNFEIVRVFPVIEYIQERYHYLGYYKGPKEIENTIYRAVTERNIRMIYMRPFKSDKFTYYTDMDDYKEMMERLSVRLSAHGIRFGPPVAMPYHSPSVYLLIVSLLGVLVLGIITLRLVFDISDRVEWMLLGVGILGIAGLNILAPNRSIELFAFVTAIVFPTFAAVFALEMIRDLLTAKRVFTLRNILARATGGLVSVFFIVLVGGLYVGAIMSRSDYLVEMNYYRGVKLSLLLPMVAFVIAYMIKLGYKRSAADIEGQARFTGDVKALLNQQVKVYYALIALLFAGIIFIYLARSGHETNLEALNIELIFRNFLEDHVLARPRTKEILVAFPALSAAFYFACRGYRKVLFPFLLAAMIGLTSVVNTFCHSRSPIYLSVARSLYGIAFSVIIGAVVILVLEGLNRLYVKHSRKN